MKTKRSGQIKRARTQISRKRVVRHRPVHKRILLHPISAFLLLCVGVLVTGSTFHGQAASYDVTAEVPAPALTQPAVITSPQDQQHSTSDSLDIQGSCPDNSYIKLFRQGVFDGVAVCENQRFTIHTSLSPGANELQVRVFNFTDDEGPGSSPITAYYDLPPVVSPPSSVPVTTLQVSNIETVEYDQGTIQDVAGNPTVSGLAPPFSDVVVTFYSEPSVCKTKADSRGVWTCTLATALSPGIHHVVIEATTPSGKKMTLPAFQVRVVEYVQPFVITPDYTYKVYKPGQPVDVKLALTGGTAPYEVHIAWGDDQQQKIVRQDQSEFTASHTYDLVDTYIVLITAVDARGASTTLQLVAVVGDGSAPVIDNGFFTGVTDTVRHWLWVVWPAYIAVVLMVVSFWIGEREAYLRFMARRRLGRRSHARSR